MAWSTVTGPVVAGTTARIHFEQPFDPSANDTSAGLRYTYDWTNDGSFEVGDGTYAGSVDRTWFGVPEWLLRTPGRGTIAGRILDKDGGCSDYLTEILIQRDSDGDGLTDYLATVPRRPIQTKYREAVGPKTASFTKTIHKAQETSVE
jgi:hypothetical protein